MSKLVLPDKGYDWRCQRCLHQWRSRHPNEPPPVSCSKCRSAYWRIPKKEKWTKPDPKKYTIGVDMAQAGETDITVETLLPPPHLRQPAPEPEPVSVPESDSETWDVESESEPETEEVKPDA